MSTITIRLFHHPSRTPIAELQGVDPGATLSSLRAMAERHLAAEEACMMRVFARWHIEVQLGARKAVVELTAQDEAASLSSLGIEDYSAVLLEGPLTGDFEGVGQGLALVAAQVREQNKRLEEQSSRVEGILLRIADGVAGMSAGISDLVAGQSALVTMQQFSGQILLSPIMENAARLVLAAEERLASSLLSLQKETVTIFLAVAGEEAKARDELLVTISSEYHRFFRFAIDTTTPLPNVRLEGPHTAVMTGSGSVTLRTSQPLSTAHHRWAVRIHEGGSRMAIQGLLPKLSADKEAKMDGTSIDGLGGWCIRGDSSVWGDWRCEKFPIEKGDLVLFDYSFADKTLTIRCGGRQVVGRIPNAGAELYPAFTLYYPGAKVSFEQYP